MKKSEVKKDLNLSQYKVLISVYELNLKELYPTHRGVYNILTGAEDNETILYTNLRTYGSLISIQKRRASAIINSLIKSNLLEEVFDRETDELYLKVTSEGEYKASFYLHKHKDRIKKVERKIKKEIIHL